MKKLYRTFQQNFAILKEESKLFGTMWSFHVTPNIVLPFRWLDTGRSDIFTVSVVPNFSLYSVTFSTGLNFHFKEPRVLLTEINY